MKKLLFLSIVAVASLASCKKDRTCTCTDSSGNTQVYTLTKISKGEAKDACLATSTHTSGSSTNTTTCTLK
ncbi:MAG: hypothetical protein ACXVNN_01715 [Bacteroidia bacterium]